jgi:hypothetical protein
VISSPINISLVNLSTAYPDASLPALANALQIQISRDYFPEWGVQAKVWYTPTGKNPTASHWALGLFDDTDQAGALGYHDITATGQPLGKVFVKTTLAAGLAVESTASHECLEMLGDPDVNLSAQDSGTKFWAYEMCDMVENDSYDITIPAGWAGAGTVVPVSNFALPAWWETSNPGPWDFLKKLTAPFTLDAGGYMSYLDLANASAGWVQITARGMNPAERAHARPYAGSRRLRRTIPRDQWIPSTYTPGAEAVPAEAA